jgi:hypothetical protein
MMALEPWGINAELLGLIDWKDGKRHVFDLEVLHGVLYPEVHSN